MESRQPRQMKHVKASDMMRGNKTGKALGAKDKTKDIKFYAQKLLGQRDSENGSAGSEENNMEDIIGDDTGNMNDTMPLASPPDLDPISIEVASEEATQPTLSEILHAVQKCTASVDDLKEKFGGLKETVSLLRHDIQKIRERTTAAEGRISDLEDQLTPMSRDVREITQQAIQALNKSDDIENRLRRNNVRIVGLPEKVEGRDPTGFVETWLQEVFGKEAFSPQYTVERAHRVPPRPNPPGGPPRSILARILNYRDREVILRLARDKGTIQFNGAKVSFFPDFSPEVQRQRSKFAEVKKRLIRLQLSYAMLFPAKLRVTAGGQVHFFESPSAAAEWMDRNEQSLRRGERHQEEG